MARILINCDLGESEADTVTAELAGLIDAANICCGVHAGSVGKTRTTLGLAMRCGALVGAHPGLAGAGGRVARVPAPETLDGEIRPQLEMFFDTARATGCSVHHVKPHGTLYHAVERDPAVAHAMIRILARFPGAAVFCLAGGSFAARARAEGFIVFEEIFADRAYADDGTLVPRGIPGAVLTSPAAALMRMREWSQTGLMRTMAGRRIPLRGQTVCVHADSPGAVPLLRGLRSAGETR